MLPPGVLLLMQLDCNRTQLTWLPPSEHKVHLECVRAGLRDFQHSVPSVYYSGQTRMRTPERQLRFLQVGCLLVLLAGTRLAWSVQGTTHGTPVVRWIVRALALACAVQGFTLQRRIVGRPNRISRGSGRSTPFTRWRAGNIVRLAFATAVGLYGLLLSEFGGPLWQVDSLFVIGLVLLLIWKPGKIPRSAEFTDPRMPDEPS